MYGNTLSKEKKSVDDILISRKNQISSGTLKPIRSKKTSIQHLKNHGSNSNAPNSKIVQSQKANINKLVVSGGNAKMINLVSAPHPKVKKS
jgi:hypothetical protein